MGGRGCFRGDKSGTSARAAAARSPLLVTSHDFAELSGEQARGARSHYNVLHFLLKDIQLIVGGRLIWLNWTVGSHCGQFRRVLKTSRRFYPGSDHGRLAGFNRSRSTGRWCLNATFWSRPCDPLCANEMADKDIGSRQVCMLAPCRIYNGDKVKLVSTGSL